MSYKLTESVPYLLNRIGVTLGERFTARLRDYGITLTMYRVLAALNQTESQTLSELSKLITVDISTLSRRIGSMENMSLITRIRPADNARIVQISLTPTGLNLVEKLIPIAIHFEDVAVSDLKESQIKELKSILNNMQNKLLKL